jgi:hypothetical protein
MGTAQVLVVATGELWTAQSQFVVPPQGLCVSVDSVNDALAWLTIEAGSAPYDVQLWFSTYGLAELRVSDIEKRWALELKKILASQGGKYGESSRSF